ncbi:MAG: FtsX-like permease family protein [Parachlamydiales bacterium]|jgi:lipoprotein-releasing system permease protein
MYELSVAFKYLLPRWRQLSVSIISLISIVVIALVVWLIVVFFSVTHGLEKTWIQKLVAVTAPVRVIPNSHYYKSYYYLIDGISSASNYSLKNLAEKLQASSADPYDPEYDEEVPKGWLPLVKNTDGEPKDIVKEAFASVQTLKNVDALSAHAYEIAYADLTLNLQSQPDNAISQPSYVTTLEPSNPALSIAMIKGADLAAYPKDGILLPKLYKDSGARIGDKGWLAYQAPTATAVQEQRLPITVAGFYDPGILPMGGKFILAPPAITSTIRAAQTMDDGYPTNGIAVTFEDPRLADDIKLQIQQELEKRGIGQYWTVESYRDFPPTRDLLQQLKSERTLYSLIASIVIVVACSNIVSLLIILVNDKKEEIGILRAMGASVLSITLIFGLCGSVMGALGSFIGISLALFTLANIQHLVNFISAVQGHELLNPIFYGDQLPTHVSNDALFFVLVATAAVSTVAGIVPAIKACIMQPSQLLRTE